VDGLHFSILVPSIEAAGERFDGGTKCQVRMFSLWHSFSIVGMY
jgi:hypothetical protein